MLKYTNCTTKVRSNVYNQQDILHGYCSYFNSVIIKVSKHFCAILRRNQLCELNEPLSFPCHFMSVELFLYLFYDYRFLLMVMKLSFTSQTYHKSSIPIKGSWSYMYVLSTLPTSPFFPETFPFFTDFRRDFNCPWSLLSYHFACLKFGINTLSKLSCNGWQSQWVSWHTFP